MVGNREGEVRTAWSKRHLRAHTEWQEDIPGRRNGMCAGMKVYRKEKCGVPKC